MAFIIDDNGKRIKISQRTIDMLVWLRQSIPGVDSEVEASIVERLFGWFVNSLNSEGVPMEGETIVLDDKFFNLLSKSIRLGLRTRSAYLDVFEEETDDITEEHK